MALELDPNWPGISDKDESEDPYINRTEVKRIAGEMSGLLDKLTASSGILQDTFVTAPGDTPPEVQLPAGAGTLPDLQQHCALSENQMGKWPAAVQFSFAANWAYQQLVGEQGSKSGKYAVLLEQADKTFDALVDIKNASQRAEQASEEAAARQET
ncbi:hypothetical protein [Nonomuraea sp. NPDC049695]|uniref:hypothetical protein n=1 Tax=Nonomuraea sp. NPDC049695 TaxID=3154734 RepID=UPI00342DD7EB